MPEKFLGKSASRHRLNRAEVARGEGAGRLRCIHVPPLRPISPSSRQRFSFMPSVRTPMPSALAVRTRWPLNCWSVLRITCFSMSASGRPASPSATGGVCWRLQPRLDRLGADHARLAFQNHRPLDDVLQFANVARPVVMLQAARSPPARYGGRRLSRACSPGG